MKKLIAIGLLFISLGCKELIAQPFYFKHYQVENGLSNNTIFSVIQDKRGFMWFGSKEGLIRFDGSTFRTYNHQRFPENIRGFILCISTAKDGNLWIGTRAGVYRFDEQTETFTLIASIPKLEIDEIKTDDKGRLWVLVGGRLYCYDQSKNIIRRHLFYKDQKIASFTYASGVIWACTEIGGIYSYQTSKDKFLFVNPGHRVQYDNRTRITQVYFKDQDLYIGSNHGLKRFNTVSKTYYTVIDANKLGYPVFVRDIIQSSKDEFWIATEAGLFLYSPSNDHLINLKRDYNDPYSLSDNSIYSLFKDTEGGMWVSSYFGGVDYYHPNLSFFKKHFAGSSMNSLSGNGVREICKDNYDNLWIGTEDGGLNKMDRRTGKISVFRYSLGGKGVSSDNIHGLLANGRELWIGHFERGLDVLDIATGKIIRRYNSADPSNGLKTNFITVLYKTKKNIIYVGTDKGLYRYIPEGDSFALVPGLPPHSYVTAFLEDRQGTLWVGTIGDGLYFNHNFNERWRNLHHQPGEGNSLSNNMVSGIFQDSNDNYWISTENGGMNVLSHDKKKVLRLTTNDGLPSNLVLKALEDLEGNIWITTSKGLVRYNPQQKSWLIFNKSHGLLTEQFNYNSAFDDQGTFYLGTVRGLISFVPTEFKPPTAVPPVYITSFQVDNTELTIDSTILRRSITHTDTLKLNYNQSSFSIGFAALTYIFPQVPQYAYKMDGLDIRWTFLANNRSVYFTDLSPGTYIFRIKTKDQHNSVENERNLVVIILKPYWLSNFAIILYVLVITSVIYFSISTYHRRNKAKNRQKLTQISLLKEKEIYRAKIEFFTNVAHEIRTPLTLIKGPLENVIDEIGTKKSVQKNLKSIERNTERLLSLTNQLLDFRKTEKDELSLSFVKTDVSKFLSKIIDSYRGIVMDKHLNLRYCVYSEELKAYIDREAFTKIIDNLMTNAIKYAKQDVLVELCIGEGINATFSVKISNDGFLIPDNLREKIFESFYRIADTEHLSGSGIGLSLARSLAEIHGGSLVLENSDSALNVFVFTLPIHQNVEFNLPNIKKTGI